MSETLLELVIGFRSSLDDQPSLERLQEIRDQMDSAVFKANVRQALLIANDLELRDALTRLQRSAEAHKANLENWRELFRIGGVGAGGGLFGASLIAMLTVTGVGAFGAIGLIGGGILVARSSKGTIDITERVELLRQIADIAKTSVAGGP